MWRIAYLYLIVPFIIFCLGWLKWFYSIPLVAVMIVACLLSLRQHKNFITINIRKHRRTVWLCIALLALWIFFSGIGQFSYQNRDHYARNAILRDLVEQPWPLVYDLSTSQPYGITQPGEYLLVYYLGYWLPAAVFGKLFGLQAAHFFLFLWTILGVMLVFYFICRHVRKIRLWIVFVFMLFGGMDVIPFLINGNYSPTAHLEWWHNDYQQYTSNTSLVYWVFNQSIAPWLMIAMFFNRVPRQNILFLSALCFFYAPFPFLGLIPFIAYFVFVPDGLKKLNQLFSFQNTVAAGMILLLMLGYYSSVSSGNHFNFYIRPFSGNIYFYIIEFLLPVMLLLFYPGRRLLVIIITAVLVLLSYVQYEHAPDLMMRASIPALFILMILCIEVLTNQGKSVIQYALAIIIAIASITSLNEIMRSVYYTVKYWYTTAVRHEQPSFSLLQKPEMFKGRNPVIKTLLSNTTSSFYRRFCRKN